MTATRNQWLSFRTLEMRSARSQLCLTVSVWSRCSSFHTSRAANLKILWTGIYLINSKVYFYRTWVLDLTPSTSQFSHFLIMHLEITNNVYFIWFSVDLALHFKMSLFVPSDSAGVNNPNLQWVVKLILSLKTENPSNCFLIKRPWNKKERK